MEQIANQKQMTPNLFNRSNSVAVRNLDRVVERLSNRSEQINPLLNHVKRNELLIISELLYRDICDEVIKSDFNSPSIPDVLYEVIKEMFESYPS